jgi:hypothetical protein
MKLVVVIEAADLEVIEAGLVEEAVPEDWPEERSSPHHLERSSLCGSGIQGPHVPRR